MALPPVRPVATIAMIKANSAQWKMRVGRSQTRIVCVIKILSSKTIPRTTHETIRKRH